MDPDPDPAKPVGNTRAGNRTRADHYARIRKSISYMSQDHAILFTKAFLSIWNSHRIRGLLGVV